MIHDMVYINIIKWQEYANRKNFENGRSQAVCLFVLLPDLNMECQKAGTLKKCSSVA